MAEAEDLKSSQCGFDPHSGHQFVRKIWFISAVGVSPQVRKICL